MSHHNGMAPPELLAELHRAVLETLLDRLSRPRVGTEQLAVARAFVRDNQAALAISDATQKRLEMLYVLLVGALVKGLEENPSAGMIGEVRSFLAQQGIHKDAIAAADKATTTRALKALSGLEIPFKTKH